MEMAWVFLKMGEMERMQARMTNPHWLRSLRHNPEQAEAEKARLRQLLANTQAHEEEQPTVAASLSNRINSHLDALDDKREGLHTEPTV